MNNAKLLQKLKQAHPGAILETGKFGRVGSPTAWVEMKSLLEVARAVCTDTETPFSWLENLSMMQMEDAIVATYFVRPAATGTPPEFLVLRASAVPTTLDQRIEIPSVRAVWPMARSFEEEVADLFGVTFLGESGRALPVVTGKLPEGWRGFPLRKGYIFPKEFLGIPHRRAEG